MTDSAQPPAAFTMLGSPDAAACEGDSCLVPGAVTMPDVEPTPDEASAASTRAVTAALDEGASL